MDVRIRFWPLLLAVFGAIFLNAVLAAAETVPPRPSYDGCLTCHPKVAKARTSSNRHAPFREKRCGSCHDPHAARFDGLTGKPPETLCRDCHDEQSEKTAGAFAHQPFEQGRCISCHDPHGSETGHLLRADGQALCFGCHSKEAFEHKRQHGPVARGDCLSCHAAHSSPVSGLRRSDTSTLCRGCHSTASERARSGHRGRDVEGADCLTCHGPHGGDKRGLVKPARHQPYAQGRCETCHQGPSKSDVAGASVCLGCHRETAGEFMAMSSHVGPGVFCVSCHSPHASDKQALQRTNQKRMCLECHSDTRAGMSARGVSHRHPLVGEGKCSACHRPHGSNQSHMLREDELSICSSCHKRHATFTHPMGPKVKDPRSKAPMSCITCHVPMGGPAEFNLRFDRGRELCVQCHKGY